MTGLEIDWSNLAPDGSDFQDLCEEVLVAHGFRARQRGPGGDGGRDIVVFERGDEIVDLHRIERYWIECKYTRSRSVGHREVRESISFVINRELSAYVLMTNSKLTNPAYDYIASLNSMSQARGVHYGVLEGRDIADIIARDPQRYGRFFPTLKDLPAKESPAVRASVAYNSRYTADIDEARIVLRNTSGAPERLLVRTPGGQAHTVTLDPLSSRTMNFSITAAGIGAVSFVSEGETQSIEVTDARPDARLRHVDEVYADPHQMVASLRSRVHAGDLVIIEGSPGCGKSRLLRELSRGGEALGVDLSGDDYRHSLLDHIVGMVADTPRSLLGSEAAREGALRCSNFDAGLLRALEAHYSGDGSDVRSLCSALAEAFAFKAGNTPIFIDNMHRLSGEDVVLLTALGCRPERPALILASRSSEFQSAEARTLLQHLSSLQGSSRVDMDAVSPRQGILSHITAASQDDATKRFLSKMAHQNSFQRYILALKALKTNGLLLQGDDGRLVVAEAPQHGARTAYLATIRDLVAPLETAFGPDGLWSVLRTSAVLGHSFELDALQHILGDWCVDVCDELVAIDLMISSQFDDEFSFDHELTQEAIYGGMPRSQRRTIHGAVYTAMQDWEMTPSRLRTRSRHAWAFGARQQALSDLHQAARGLADSGRYSSAYEAQVEASRLIDEADRSGMELADRDALEVETFAGLVRLAGLAIGHYQSYLHAQRLAVIAFDRQFETALANEHIAEHLSATYRGPEAAARMKLAIELYSKAQPGGTDHIRCVCRLGNILKRNFADYVGCLRQQTTALRLLRERSQEPSAGRVSAYGLVGAALIEAGKLKKALPWYERAWREAAKVGDRHAVASRLISFSYLAALLEPRDPGTEALLRNALSQAEKAVAAREIARASLNLANYLHFENVDPAEANILHAKASAAADAAADDYIGVLCRFTSLMFRADAVTRLEVEQFAIDARQRCPELFLAGSATDIRARNMVDYLTAQGLQTEAFNHQQKISDLYRRGNRYITYY
jgi:hypothetical protein